MQFLSILMTVFLGVVLWAFVSPELCSAPPENLRYMNFAAFFFLAWLVWCLLTGVARFRSSRVLRAENPFDYWLMMLILSGFTLSLFYPMYAC